MHPTYGSICSGLEAATVAWRPLGWYALWFSEIEPMPCAVLAHHYPDVPNLGDMTGIAARIRAGAVPAPDILVGGTPCQSFSIAGRRRSLADPRGNLTLAYVELADAIDQARAARNEPPAILVWENVPGVLSTADNAFGCFLAGLAGEDVALRPAGRRWTNAGAVYGPDRTIAWRTLDAQYFGLAQRRKRVFVVASAGDRIDPAEVLFEWDRVRRDSAPCRETRQNAADDAADCVTGRCAKPSDSSQTTPSLNRIVDTAFSLTASQGHHGHGSARGDGHDNLITDIVPASRSCDTHTSDDHPPGIGANTWGSPVIDVDRMAASTEPLSNPVTCHAPPLSLCLNGGRMGRKDAESETSIPMIVPRPDLCLGMGTFYAPLPQRDPALQAFAQNQRDELRVLDIAGAVAARPGAKQQTFVAFDYKNSHPSNTSVDLAPTLRAMGHARSHANGGGHLALIESLTLALRGRRDGLDLEYRQDGTANAVLTPNGGRAGIGVGAVAQAVTHGQTMRVRRLTPCECERLQGYPDDYSLVPVPLVNRRGTILRWTLAKDAPRYRALGNSMAVPCMRWIGERIEPFAPLA